jgi:Type II restriction endonuclease EcoO109I
MGEVHDLAEIHPVIVRTFAEYVQRRREFYENPSAVLKKLLLKDVLLYALRGVEDSDQFVDHAFPALESSSEETMWGNSWQQALANVAPNTVGGGDLRTEREGVLWIIQLKLGPQNASSQAQDLRILKAKVLNESRDHHPGRKGVKPMYAIVRGASRDEWRYVKGQSQANKDIESFGYQYMQGLAFLRWISADFDPAALVAALESQIGPVPDARAQCVRDLKVLLRERLASEGLGNSITDVLALADRNGPARRNSLTQDQSSA